MLCFLLFSTLSMAIVNGLAIHRKPMMIPPESNGLRSTEISPNEPLNESTKRMAQQDIVELRSNDPNMLFAESLAKINQNFENIPAQYIGPNYKISSYDPSSKLMTMNGYGPGMAMFSSESQSQSNGPPPKEDTINDMFENTFKKYDVKRYLLKKILGNSHDLDEDEGGFFSNKHLKRHGTAGVAAKVLGELIGIKIRESIEGLGKSFSEYAKDFTARNFVNLGQLFTKVFKPTQ